MNAPSSYKILVVDDTEATQYALARVLKKEGFQVVTASSGAEALAMAQEHLPDLITLDIHLPDISGFEVCKKIKSTPETAATAVLQISASYVTSTDRIYGLDGGADGYLTHPVEAAVLIATVRSLLRLRSVGESLRESEERFRLAVQITQLGTWDYTPATQSLHWSDQCKVIFGFGKDEEVTYQDYLNCLHPEEREWMLEKINEVVANKKTEISNEHRIVHRNGEVRWILGRGAAHYKFVNGQKQLHRIVGTVLDITDRKANLIELQKAKELAESANKAKTQFIANVSHEIRTPLGAILGFSELVTEGNDLSEEKKDFMQVIQRNALQLSHLIDEILDLSKVEAEKMVIEYIPFNFTEMINDLISLFEMKSQEKGLIFTLDLAPSIPKLLVGDPTRWRQILINLLNNAVKFTDKGTVQLKVTARPLVKTTAAVALEFDVIDTGIGVTETQAAGLFQPFMQADSSMTRRFGGTGLGLSLSRKLAQAMNGDLVLLKSKQGQGSTFRLTLNADLVAALPLGVGTAQEQTLQQVEMQKLKGLRLLVVEDSKDNQTILERILVRAGAEIELADNGSEGVSVAKHSPQFDVVLMDLQMPGMDGYEAVRILRQERYSRPIIALTAHALKGERERCLQAGFSDYLTKPIDREMLVSRISSLSRTTHRIEATED